MAENAASKESLSWVGSSSEVLVIDTDIPLSKDTKEMTGTHVSVAVFDHRSWGGDGGVVDAAAAYIDFHRNDFGVAYLAFSQRGGVRQKGIGNYEARQRSRPRKVFIACKGVCTVIALDMDLILLVKSTVDLDAFFFLGTQGPLAAYRPGLYCHCELCER